MSDLQVRAFIGDAEHTHKLSGVSVAENLLSFSMDVPIRFSMGMNKYQIMEPSFKMIPAKNDGRIAVSCTIRIEINTDNYHILIDNASFDKNHTPAVSTESVYGNSPEYRNATIIKLIEVVSIFPGIDRGLVRTVEEHISTNAQTKDLLPVAYEFPGGYTIDTLFNIKTFDVASCENGKWTISRSGDRIYLYADVVCQFVPKAPPSK